MKLCQFGFGESLSSELLYSILLKSIRRDLIHMDIKRMRNLHLQTKLSTHTPHNHQVLSTLSRLNVMDLHFFLFSAFLIHSL